MMVRTTTLGFFVLLLLATATFPSECQIRRLPKPSGAWGGLGIGFTSTSLALGSLHVGGRLAGWFGSARLTAHITEVDGIIRGMGEFGVVAGPVLPWWSDMRPGRRGHTVAVATGLSRVELRGEGDTSRVGFGVPVELHVCWNGSSPHNQRCLIPFVTLNSERTFYGLLFAMTIGKII